MIGKGSALRNNTGYLFIKQCVTKGSLLFDLIYPPFNRINQRKKEFLIFIQYITKHCYNQEINNLGREIKYSCISFQVGLKLSRGLNNCFIQEQLQFNSRPLFVYFIYHAGNQGGHFFLFFIWHALSHVFNIIIITCTWYLIGVKISLFYFTVILIVIA